MRTALLACLLVVVPTLAAAQVSGKSPTCVEVASKMADNRNNALAFCRTVVTEPGIVSGVIAMETLL